VQVNWYKGHGVQLHLVAAAHFGFGALQGFVNYAVDWCEGHQVQ
jgi:hypothetical protein